VVTIRRRPLDKRDDLKRILNSTKKYYEFFSDEYVKFYKNWLKAEGQFSNPKYKMGYDKVAKILTQLVNEGQLILDLGCGVGTWSVLMAKAGAEVIGVDYSYRALLKCEENSVRFHVESKVTRILGNGFYLPFKDETFDGATLNWVLAHIPSSENQRFMREVVRV
jgi:ubiquinone/menaquinone biosynthesis C-methylase UbiE